MCLNETRSNKRKLPLDNTITGFETKLLQRRRGEENKIGMLPYCFDQHDEVKCVVEIMFVSVKYPILFPNVKSKK